MIATSRGDYSRLAQSLGVHFFQDADDFAEEHPEIVVLASSILSTEAVLDSLPVQRLKRSTLFVDVLSVKEFPKQLFLSKLPAQVSCASVFDRVNNIGKKENTVENDFSVVMVTLSFC